MFYRGRFAPTPSGPLHFGSLFAAVVSWLDAHHHNGEWLVRIDDLDPPREVPGAAHGILKTLERHGLMWDAPVTYQSNNADRYEANLALLAQQHRLFWCRCSRKTLKGTSVYPGYCRACQTPRDDSAIRLRVLTEQTTLEDRFQGMQTVNLAKEYGDVILKRRDGFFAYQLAVVSDDIEAGVTDVVRGIDLMPSTFWQQELYQLLNAPQPRYAHFAVLCDPNSRQKLSKQNLAPAIDDNLPEANLMAVFALLQMPITPDSCEQMLQQALSLYRPEQLIGKETMQVAQSGLN
ncbi:tRNA glutamyl-Q(34) synthetase GluQRS [Reinekea blandensis]|uniref:Glutamyl-Q tRNA(Asp) synthetase n=1 Tax=Reinekea blandensis MED297 TaxID=314283 RepID=A4BJT7_9GAMM|nr:tRNA glutamyl-Q(34) synthetase GluQRS [Reinekea blandensis]EAR07604.1 Glutamyl-tRNA synthetase related protein [Reinekea sp. MED297] [Reinekea blandensis MED297]